MKIIVKSYSVSCPNQQEFMNIKNAVISSVVGAGLIAGIGGYVRTGKYTLKNSDTGQRRRIHIHRKPRLLSETPSSVARLLARNGTKLNDPEYDSHVDEGKIVHLPNDPTEIPVKHQDENLAPQGSEPLIQITLNGPCDADQIPDGEQNVLVPLELVSIARQAALFRKRDMNLLLSIKTKLLVASQMYEISEFERHKYVTYASAFGITPSAYELAAVQHLESADVRQKCQIVNTVYGNLDGSLEYTETPIENVNPFTWSFRSGRGETETRAMPSE
jgi:hypothetical protein